MKLLFVVISFWWLLPGQAQVGIGTTSPNSSSVLDLNSITKGLLIPRMTSAQRTAITSPATGLLVYDTDAANFYFYSGSAWVQALGPAGTNGTDGKTILSGTLNPPGAGVGTTGDFYLNTTLYRLFGPKSAGGWPSPGVSLIGPQGPQGPPGTGTNNFSIFSNTLTNISSAGIWGMFPMSEMVISTNGVLMNVSVSVSFLESNQDVTCSLCYGSSLSGPFTPIEEFEDIQLTHRVGMTYQIITLAGKIVPPSTGNYWIGPCFKFGGDNLRIKAAMGYGIVLD